MAPGPVKCWSLRSPVILRSFSERSFPLTPGDLAQIIAPAAAGGAESVRAWLRRAHLSFKHLLPRGDAPLLTEDLVRSDGRPVDVFAYFGMRPEGITGLRHNLSGITQTAQASGANSEVDVPTPPWPGFEDVWIPVGGGIEICGRVAYARGPDGLLDADCIVILPGILGDNNVLRTRDLAAALLADGFHVMALELRGHGETARGRPDIYYDFGTLETGDLLAVSNWLESLPHVRRTGLIGYCWGANQALMTAWYDGCPADHLSIARRMGSLILKDATRRHWRAGIMAFSPVLRFEELIDALHEKISRMSHPVLAGLQTSIYNRMRRRGFPEPCGSLYRLILEEFARTPLNYPEAFDEAVRFLRFLPYKGLPDGNKLANMGVPVLIVHGANDPLAPAQDVADLMATSDNSNVAALVLAGGGHVGFAAYARAYYYSLILNFFSPEGGPRIASERG